MFSSELIQARLNELEALPPAERLIELERFQTQLRNLQTKVAHMKTAATKEVDILKEKLCVRCGKSFAEPSCAFHNGNMVVRGDNSGAKWHWALQCSTCNQVHGRQGRHDSEFMSVGALCTKLDGHVSYDRRCRLCGKFESAGKCGHPEASLQPVHAPATVLFPEGFDAQPSLTRQFDAESVTGVVGGKRVDAGLYRGEKKVGSYM
eukprot:TRINITY_DN25090_c0_g1_i1.p1 TRINITY_DN25090_c0_g1~~TRINITY_DN25090_c0_g1_i1.p1  ORF type:complete len:206 (-),score=25.93 TRINITY_DN25090_c0_g1_i1:289-906(-)